jgi:type II secretory ATPase GspE/PulE/Tfp pilus assembly ATPase PilB-like protein
LHFSVLTALRDLPALASWIIVAAILGKGMKTLLDLAIIKVLEGKTTPEEVKRVIAPERFQ